MIKNEVVISDYYELLALHKALIEAKFHTEPENLLISGSPYIADICNKVVQALIEIETQKDASKQNRWMEWLNIKNQKTFWNRAIKYAQEFNLWDRMNNNEKKKYVMCLLAPFKFNEEDIVRFISEVDINK